MPLSVRMLCKLDTTDLSDAAGRALVTSTLKAYKQQYLNALLDMLEESPPDPPASSVAPQALSPTPTLPKKLPTTLPATVPNTLPATIATTLPMTLPTTLPATLPVPHEGLCSAAEWRCAAG